MKLFVLAATVLSMALVERMILYTGVNASDKLVAASLIVIGTAEAFSILDNLCYFFPPMKIVADKARELLGKGKEK